MCINPINAWRLKPDFEKLMSNNYRGQFISDQLTNSWIPKLIFKQNFNLPKWLHGAYEHLLLPCGKCIECRLKHAKMWSLRCVHEQLEYGDNCCFLTLTYNQQNVPIKEGAPPGVYSLQYSDVQKFMKLLRKYVNKSHERYCRLYNLPYDKKKDYIKIRFFCSSEYGTKTHRPHYHLIIYNWRPRSKQLSPWSNGKSGLPTYRCYPLERFCWKKGMVNVGFCVSKQAAGYIARYTLEKTTDNRPDDFYQFREKEGLRMSRRSGIGCNWIKKPKNAHFVLNNGFITLNDNGVIRKYAVPRAYKTVLEREYPDDYLKLKNYFIKLAKEHENDFEKECMLQNVKTYKRRISLTEYYNIVANRLKRGLTYDKNIIQMNC